MSSQGKCTLELKTMIRLPCKTRHEQWTRALLHSFIHPLIRSFCAKQETNTEETETNKTNSYETELCLFVLKSLLSSGKVGEDTEHNK